MSRATLLIHGPFAGNCYQRIADSLSQSASNPACPIEKIVVSTYQGDAQRTEQLLRTAFVGKNVEVASFPDVANPGFYNINRQVHLVQNALRQLDNDSLVIKLRNDQCVNFTKLHKVLGGFNYLSDTPDKIVTTNCYTRSDRLYHPSDMFLCALSKTLSKYYSLPYQTQTHMDCVLSIAQQHARTPMKAMPGAPEELLFRNYLKHQGWSFSETQADSLAAIREYCYVANSWDVELTWTKQRTPFRGADTLVLPYRFTMEPFPGGPRETAKCWSRHEIHGGSPSLLDIYYLRMSDTLWKLSGGKMREPDYLKRRIIKLSKSITKRLRRDAA